jgi:hypothetical protein
VRGANISRNRGEKGEGKQQCKEWNHNEPRIEASERAENRDE